MPGLLARKPLVALRFSGRGSSNAAAQRHTLRGAGMRYNGHPWAMYTALVARSPMTLLNSIFLLAYLLCAAVQVNDADAAHWIALYLAAALMCAAQYRRKLARWVPLALLLTSLAWIATLLPGLAGTVSWSEVFASLGMRTRAIEEAREIGGLALVALWSGVLLARHSPTPP
ncbi:MAG: transmembrane 220 family protein [Gammaproteobacteria bacterium]|nr:transmembrane 220 family protein [Gammaproteobacteria bacterium]